MQKRYAPLFIVLGLAALAVVAGVILKAPEPLSPIKILMPNAGGRVVFNHRQHAEDYGFDCTICHHERELSSYEPQPCGSCHGVTFDQKFVADHQKTFGSDYEACLTCHHTEITETAWNRDMHDLHAESIAESCQTCHHEMEDFGTDAQSCATEGCHERLAPGQPAPADAQPPLYRDAVHTTCATCHPHTEAFEEGLDGCASCHDLSTPRKDYVAKGLKTLPKEQIDSFSKCAACHYEKPVEEVFLDRMSAYHKQCGDCHAERGGPSVEQAKNQCYQCHIR